MKTRFRLVRRRVSVAVILNLLAGLTAHSQSAVDSFDPDVNGPIWAIAVQADGRILVGGQFTAVEGTPRTNLARLLPDGRVDAAFNPGASGGYGAVYCLATQPDGRILVGGDFTVLEGQPRDFLGRLNSDGSLDESFNPGADDEVNALVVQADGRILVGGEFQTLAGYAQEFLGRLDSDGNMDPDFPPSPRVTGVVYDIALQSDGRILVGGEGGYGRLNPDGNEDSGFAASTGAAGVLTVFSLAVQPDGRILVGGDFTELAGQARTNLARLNSDGSLDLAFSPVIDSAPLVWSPVLVIAVQGNGRILVGGHFTIPGDSARTNLVRLNTDGSVDLTFGCEVRGGTRPAVRALALQADAQILVGGDFTSLNGQTRNCLGRLRSGDALRLGLPQRSGELSVMGTFLNGVCTLLSADHLAGPWRAEQQMFTSGEESHFSLAMGPSNSFHKALAVELSSGRFGFTNFVESFDLLTTIAGAGGATDESNKWRPEFENAPATNVLLSGPHIAMADAAGNIFIADKNAHAIRKIRPDRILVTVAGTNTPGNAPDEPTLATQAALNGPNGLWVRPDGTVYILDTGNGKVRVLDTNGLLRTLFTVPTGILVGRGLWVSDDETRVLFSSLNTVKRWTPSDGVTNYAMGFTELGNLVVDPMGHVVATDRGTHSVWRLFEDGTRVRIAGNGSQANSPGGGDGGLATATALDGVRGVWFLPSGAFLVCTHRGSQVWYVDTGGLIHLFLNGTRSGSHGGDGTWFWAPTEYRVSECRAVTMDCQGNLLVTEHDAGYVRKVQFLRHQP